MVRIEAARGVGARNAVERAEHVRTRGRDDARAQDYDFIAGCTVRREIVEFGNMMWSGDLLRLEHVALADSRKVAELTRYEYSQTFYAENFV